MQLLSSSLSTCTLKALCCPRFLPLTAKSASFTLSSPFPLAASCYVVQIGGRVGSCVFSGFIGPRWPLQTSHANSGTPTTLLCNCLTASPGPCSTSSPSRHTNFQPTGCKSSKRGGLGHRTSVHKSPRSKPPCTRQSLQFSCRREFA